jgi:hypothetical protein
MAPNPTPDGGFLLDWPRLSRQLNIITAAIARNGASTAMVPSAKSQISYFVCLSIGRPRWDDLNRSTEKALRPPLSSIISRSSLSQAIFWRARQDAHPDHDRSHRLGRGWCRLYRCGAAFERTGKCYIGSCPSCQIENPRRAGDGKQSFVVARKLHTLILRAHELKR